MPLIVWIVTVLADQVTPYPLPVGDTASSVYSVTVNGTSVPVSNSRDASYAHFAFTGTARVVVTVSQAVNSYRLSPAAADVVPQARGSTIEWTLNRPRKLILHHVNGLAEKLCILAEPPEEDPPRAGDPGVVVLGGVDATGATDVSAGLQAALDSVPAGGTLCIPAGRYGFTTLQMRTGRNVYLAPGSALVASGTGASPGPTAQVSFTGVTDVTVSGRGVIDGRGYALRKAVNGREEGRSLISVAHGATSSRVNLSGILVRNPPVYSCIVFNTVDWRFSNVKFITDADFANRDGIAPHNSRRLIVDDCFFLTSDDCFVVSTTRPDIDLDAVVKNCVMYNSFSGAFIRHGPWIGDNTRGFTAENIDMIQGCEKAGNEAAIAFYAGGALRDVRYRNIRVEDPRGRLIYMVTDWKDHYAGVQRGSVSGVVFERLTCDGKGLVHLKGAGPSESIGQVAFMDFTYRGKAVLGPKDCDFAASGAVKDVTFVAGSSPVVSLSTSSLDVDSRTPAEVMVTRSTTTAMPLTVGLRVRGTAKAGIHYAALPASVTIPANERSARLTVQARGAPLPGGRATILVDLDHSRSRDYMLGSEYRVQLTLVDQRTE